MLMIKTEMNKCTAEWAAEQSYYDVAISRYYYSILQKMMYIALKNNYVHSDTESSHMEIFNYLKYTCKLAPEQVQVLDIFRKLKTIRIKADYRENLQTKTDFEKDFLYKYNSVNRLLEKVIEREDKNGRK